MKHACECPAAALAEPRARGKAVTLSTRFPLDKNRCRTPGLSVKCDQTVPEVSSFDFPLRSAPRPSTGGKAAARLEWTQQADERSLVKGQQKPKQLAKKAAQKTLKEKRQEKKAKKKAGGAFDH